MTEEVLDNLDELAHRGRPGPTVCGPLLSFASFLHVTSGRFIPPPEWDEEMRRLQQRRRDESTARERARREQMAAACPSCGRGP